MAGNNMAFIVIAAGAAIIGASLFLRPKTEGEREDREDRLAAEEDTSWQDFDMMEPGPGPGAGPPGDDVQEKLDRRRIELGQLIGADIRITEATPFLDNVRGVSYS